MTVMAGEFPLNIERRREPARAQLTRRVGAPASPIGARRSRNWSDREDFQERTDIEPCGAAGAARLRAALAVASASAMKTRVSPLKARERRPPEYCGYCWLALAKLPPHPRRTATAGNPPARSPRR